MSNIVLKPFGGVYGIAELCGKQWNEMYDKEKSYFEQECKSVGYYKVLQKYKPNNMQCGFEKDKKRHFDEKTVYDMDRLVKTNINDLVTKYCCSRSSIPFNIYIKNIIKRDDYGYSYQIPWLYTLSIPPTTFEQYVNKGPVIFTDKNGVTPSQTFIDKNKKMFFFDEQLDEYNNDDDDNDNNDDINLFESNNDDCLSEDDLDDDQDKFVDENTSNSDHEFDEWDLDDGYYF